MHDFLTPDEEAYYYGFAVDAAYVSEWAESDYHGAYYVAYGTPAQHNVNDSYMLIF